MPSRSRLPSTSRMPSRSRLPSTSRMPSRSSSRMQSRMQTRNHPRMDRRNHKSENILDPHAVVQDNDPDSVKEPADSVMGNCIRAVVARLRIECSQNYVGEKWLLKMLNADTGVSQCWVLRPARARAVCTALRIHYHLPAFYRKVYFWAPHLQFGREAVPRCVGCNKSNS